MSVQTKDMPTDIYGRYAGLVKELIKASNLAGRSDDNTEMLMKVLGVVAVEHGYEVNKKKEVVVKEKTVPKKKGSQSL